MAGFGRMNEEGRGAGGRECRGDLAGDMPRLADAGDYNASAAFKQEIYGVRKCVTQPVGKGGNRGGFNLEHLTRQRQRVSPRQMRSSCLSRGGCNGYHESDYIKPLTPGLKIGIKIAVAVDFLPMFAVQRAGLGLECPGAPDSPA